MSTRTVFTRLAALGGAAALVVSGATGVANAQGSMTESAGELAIDVIGSVEGSVAEAPPSPPPSPISSAT